MAPNNDVRQPDAKTIARQRFEHGQVTNLFDDLIKLEGSAIGSQYICTTSDLALLASSFADSNKTQRVNIGGLPKVFRDHLIRWIDPERIKGMTEEERTELANEQAERGNVLTNDPKGGRNLGNVAGVPGSVLTVRTKSDSQLEVTAYRKAFRLNLPKSSLLPGVYALGGPSFEGEQEMHGLTRVNPLQIKEAFDAKTLKEEFPVVTGGENPDAASTATPTTAVGPDDVTPVSTPKPPLPPLGAGTIFDPAWVAAQQKKKDEEGN
jgi:hypothetical protein